MATLEKLVLDAKRISNRLNDKLVLGDSLINEIEFVNEQLKTLRTVSCIDTSFNRSLFIQESKSLKSAHY